MTTTEPASVPALTTLDDYLDPQLLDNFRQCPPYFKANTLQGILATFPPPLAQTPPLDPRVHREDRLIPAAADHPAIPVRVYQPAHRDKTAKLPVFLWIHGGGFLGGSLKNEDLICQQRALACHCVIVSLDYRLIPEHPFPAAFNDCYGALVWIMTGGLEADTVDLARVAVGGCSAGGCLAAGVVQRAMDEGIKLCFQLLMIPVLDNRHNTPSSHAIHDYRVWNRTASQLAWQAYLPNETGPLVHYATPGRRADLGGLPATFMSVEGLDLLRDEALDYAQRLAQAGVPCELHLYPGTYHGSFNATPEADISQQHFRAVSRALQAGLWPQPRA